MNHSPAVPRSLPTSSVPACLRRALTPGVLSACLALSAGSALAQGSPGGGLFQSNANSATKLDDPKPEGGWDALARLLDKARPSVDTRLDPTPSQVTDRIEKLIAENRLDEALALVQKREAELNAQSAQGATADVQLQFQHARTLDALGRKAEAEKIYATMTTLYPELSEPWNNLAVIYVSRGELERASDALNQALQANPRDNTARVNLADVQLMMAQRTYRQAGQAPRQLPAFDPDAPASAGPRSAGPRSAGPRSAGPLSAGPLSAGPLSAGPRSAGPRQDPPSPLPPVSSNRPAPGAVGVPALPHLP